MTTIKDQFKTPNDSGGYDVHHFETDADMVDGLADFVQSHSTSAVTSVNNKTGAVTITKSDLSLGNVDNTADANKSVNYATSAGKLATARAINGVNFDGSAAALFGGYCSTSAATAAKTVAISNYTLTSYSVVCVMFRYANTAANPTLNVNSTGAYAIKMNNAAQTKVTWGTYQPVFFMYYSSAWHIIDPCVNPNSLSALSASGSTLTYTKGDGSTGTVTVSTNYTLPTASSSVLGGVKVGTNLTISNGVLSATGGATFTATNVSNANLNNLTTAGIYYSSNCSNAPNNAGSAGFVTVITCGNLIIQTFTPGFSLFGTRYSPNKGSAWVNWTIYYEDEG